jgi:hypothetical protein
VVSGKGEGARTTAGIHWADKEPPVVVSSRERLDEGLDSIASSRSLHLPTIVEISIQKHVLSLGLGSPESFVQIQSDSRMPPYRVTVGDTGADGIATFYFMGSHHTEIRHRHLISVALAREVIREFFGTGRMSERVEWEEI